MNRRIEEGDIIVLMSDGAAGDGKWVEEALPRLGGLSPQAMAERLLAMSIQYQTRGDDRTVVAARVRKGGAMDTAIPAKLNHWQARIDADGEYMSQEGNYPPGFRAGFSCSERKSWSLSLSFLCSEKEVCRSAGVPFCLDAERYQRDQDVSSRPPALKSTS